MPISVISSAFAHLRKSKKKVYHFGKIAEGGMEQHKFKNTEPQTMPFPFYFLSLSL